MTRLRTNIHSRRQAMLGGACVLLVAVLPAVAASATALPVSKPTIAPPDTLSV